MRQKKGQISKKEQPFHDALDIIGTHPMFKPLFYYVRIHHDSSYRGAPSGYAYVESDGHMYCNPKQNLTAQQWVYVIAHGLLHFGFEHFKEQQQPVLWNIACDVSIARFLYDMKIGHHPQAMTPPLEAITKDEHKLYAHFLKEGVDNRFVGWGLIDNERDLFVTAPGYFYRDIDWGQLLAEGITEAVSRAIDVAGGVATSLRENSPTLTNAEQAKSWFLSSFPLLGSLASNFTIISDLQLCQMHQIAIAAIDITNQEIYINPAANLSIAEMKFVIAHELLHAGLCHHERRQGRDAYYWNVACDYVINDWLLEMNIGKMPEVGVLYDAELKGLSAEEIYDRIVTDLRKYRKLYTLRGLEGGDILDRGAVRHWAIRDGVTLEEFYKSCLTRGLEYHLEGNRGFLPAGLVEEIQALHMPVIRWDVELAKWFDAYFPPLEKKRSYARLSRRQASTPHIPRPSYITGDLLDGRTFAVVLDTSGSMDEKLLAKALGTIVSYSVARDVLAVRLIFCDAIAYDAGFMPVEEIAGRVEIKGRGGTVLQPAIDLLKKAPDFPNDGPILILTDGFIDRLQIHQPHAFVLPKGRRLPFVAKGDVFYID